jgi:hypothetical protein
VAEGSGVSTADSSGPGRAALPAGGAERTCRRQHRGERRRPAAHGALHLPGPGDAPSALRRARAVSTVDSAARLRGSSRRSSRAVAAPLL